MIVIANTKKKLTALVIYLVKYMNDNRLNDDCEVYLVDILSDMHTDAQPGAIYIHSCSCHFVTFGEKPILREEGCVYVK